MSEKGRITFNKGLIILNSIYEQLGNNIIYNYRTFKLLRGIKHVETDSDYNTLDQRYKDMVIKIKEKVPSYILDLVYLNKSVSIKTKNGKLLYASGRSDNFTVFTSKDLNILHDSQNYQSLKFELQMNQHYFNIYNRNVKRYLKDINGHAFTEAKVSDYKNYNWMIEPSLFVNGYFRLRNTESGKYLCVDDEANDTSKNVYVGGHQCSFDGSFWKIE
jgi:hypothetical protein